MIPCLRADKKIKLLLFCVLRVDDDVGRQEKLGGGGENETGEEMSLVFQVVFETDVSRVPLCVYT